MDRNSIEPVSIRVSTTVALRKESVDRNFVPFDVIRPAIESLSARRAWIEIKALGLPGWLRVCRSPQGERG